MVQKTYHIKEYTREKLETILSELTCFPYYTSAAQVLLIMMEQNWDERGILAKQQS